MRELGQLFITGIKGIELLPEEAEFIKENNIGGVCLFANNYEDPAQLAELINNLQTLRDEWPLFISVDQEGGRVWRFKKGFTVFPAMMDIAKLKSPKTIFEIHQVIGQELKAVGVNLNFSPVCDVLYNPQNQVIGDRSFGTDPVEVEKYVSAAIRGLQTMKVLACPKHFPGHGSTTKDSHFDLPLIKASIEEIREKELKPFMKASRSRAEFIMMAHLLVDSIDQDFPTSMSSRAYAFLRSELKYTNLIITDDLDMKAIADRFSVEESATRALTSGADVVIHRSFENTVAAFNYCKENYSKNKILTEELPFKIKRVNKCKKTHFSGYRPVYIPSIKSELNAEKAKVLLDKINKEMAAS